MSREDVNDLVGACVSGVGWALINVALWTWLIGEWLIGVTVGGVLFVIYGFIIARHGRD